MPLPIDVPFNRPVMFLAFAQDRVPGSTYLRNLPFELDGIRKALHQVRQAGLCEVVERANTTVENILDVFQEYQDRIAVFHYGGHAESYQLLLESLTGECTVAHSTGLVSFLAKQKGLKLIFLNGCCTQQQALDLVHAGIPAVVGTSQAIADEVATDLSVRFYKGLASGRSIDHAWAEAVDEVKIEQGADWRHLYADSKSNRPDRFPWDIYYRDGAEKVKDWSLPDAADNPLFGLPEIPQDYFRKLPEHPFIGLEYFKKQHAAIFFGRGAQIRQLYNYVTGIHPIILFYGESGVGKSSLLDAGLLPRLEKDYTVQYLRRDATKGLTATLIQALQAAGADTVKPIALLETWCGIETKAHRPLIIILDQAEEAFTQPLKKGHPEAGRELEVFLEALQGIFDQTDQRLKGKLILSYRKEYHPEIRETFQKFSLPYAGMFLQQLDRKGIMEAVEGLTRSPHTQAKYHLEIEKSAKGDLAETIAVDLLADQKSALAPVLQILLTKRWHAAVQENPEAPRFTLSLYQQLKNEGIAMDEFLKQQMEQLRQWNNEVVASGLALDLLQVHTTPLGTAGACAQTKLQQAYSHRQDVLDTLLVKCKGLYILINSQQTQNASTRLAHDILAPVIMREYQNSDKPGQRAARILNSKLSNYRADEALLDDADLKTVEDGRTGMRQLTEDEESLIARSREERANRERYLDGRVTEWLKELGYFDLYNNRKGKGIKHQYKTVKRHGKKLIVDHATGLTWQQSGSKRTLTHPDAEKYILYLNNQNFAGHNDWRLPTLEEAMALMEPRVKMRMIPHLIRFFLRILHFPGVLHIDSVFNSGQSWIWTSSKPAAGVAWIVNFTYGFCTFTTITFDAYVRAVRSGVLTSERIGEKLGTDVSAADRQRLMEWQAGGKVRLLTPVEREGDWGYELAHERLIQPLRRLSNKQLTEVDQANRLFERRTNEWLGNNYDAHYLLRLKELRQIYKQRLYLVWGERKEQKLELLRHSQNKLWRRTSILAGTVFSLCLLWLAWPSLISRLELHRAQLRLADSGLTWVTVVGDTFTMGNVWESHKKRDFREEIPPHLVRVADFRISTTEITVAQFCKFLNERGVDSLEGENWIHFDEGIVFRHRNLFVPKSGKENLPVHDVNWYGAEEFAEWLGGRLPLEEEWEFAARERGRWDREYILGDTSALPQVIVFRHSGTTTIGGEPHSPDFVYADEIFSQLEPVGSHAANALGLYDMSGSVAEWCLNPYSAYPESARVEAFTLKEIDEMRRRDNRHRAIRGGCLLSDACSSWRTKDIPNLRLPALGFRVVLPP